MQLKMMAKKSDGNSFAFITSESKTTDYGVFPVGEHEGKPTRSDTAGGSSISQCPLESVHSYLYVFGDCSFH